MIRWLLVILIALLLFSGLRPWLEKIGLGKLPGETIGHDYELEYGADRIEIHTDAIAKGERILLVDDLIATGGTAEGVVKLLRQLGTDVLAACFIIDLPELGGADKLRKLDVRPPMGDLRRIVQNDPALGLALRKIAEKKVSAQDILDMAAKNKKRDEKS